MGVKCGFFQKEFYMLENEVVKEIFIQKKDEVSGEFMILNKEELGDLLLGSGMLEAVIGLTCR
jgi:hypothetical protein